VKAVAPDAVGLCDMPGQGIVEGLGSDGLVKGRVEHRHLGDARCGFHGRLNAHQVGRVVKGRQWNEAADGADDPVVDDHRLPKHRAAVHHPVADAVKGVGALKIAGVSQERRDSGEAFRVATGSFSLTSPAAPVDRWTPRLVSSPMRSSTPAACCVPAAMSKRRYLMEELPELITRTFIDTPFVSSHHAAGAP
jgi:hypothetical protein